MTATIELNDRLLKKAEKLTGITDSSVLVKEALNTLIRGREYEADLLQMQHSSQSKEILWPGYDPKN
jgi:hypothetical protein